MLKIPLKDKWACTVSISGAHRRTILKTILSVLGDKNIHPIKVEKDSSEYRITIPIPEGSR